MKQGILIYALNNEQIDYVEIAYHAALQAKKHLDLPVAIITDSADWLYHKFPNYKEVFDMVIKIVHESTVENWQSNKYYGVGSLAFHNGTIWRKIKDGNEVISVINKTFKTKNKFINKNFVPVYEGIDIDKWYPNLPYLAGQHVWYDNTLYKCHTSYEENETFSKEKYEVLVQLVLDHDDSPDYELGEIVLHNRTLWQAIAKKSKKTNLDNEKSKKIYLNKKNFNKVYEGIDIDKWYPNLPYLAGQHVWYDNTLYRCHTSYEENETFSLDYYDTLLEKVLDYETDPNYKIGDIVLYNRSLWQAIENKFNKITLPFNDSSFESIYKGIDIDKWYPNLPYLAGQHVWYDNTLYKCHTDYTELDNFSIENYDILLEKVLDYETLYELNGGDIVLYNRSLWLSHIDINQQNQEIFFPEENFDRIYEGIDIDKWYPNLPYLKGQHVWHENTLYKCHTDYTELDNFSIENYDILLENVLDYKEDIHLTIGDKVLHNRVLWLTNTDIKDSIEEIEHDLSNFDRIYEGIDIDKWYPNLPYLKGQHVWHENTLYRCDIGYTEQGNFSKDKYIVILEDVYDLEKTQNYNKGEIFLHDRVLWQANTNFGLDQELISVWYNMEDLERVYEGIDIDKWYPNLPYLAGQHVWYQNILYRCIVDYEEQDIFSIDKYNIVLDNVKDLTNLDKFNIGDILLYNRVLWMSKVNYDSTLNEDKIRDDIWIDTKERHVVYNTGTQYRRYFDGTLANKRLKFKNDIRIKSFELSPFDETLVIDCDYFINNNMLKYCWNQPHDFLIFKEALDLSGYRHDPRVHTLSDKSIDFYWATVFFFRKNKNTETFFSYLGHIQDNWDYYRYVYQIQNSMYRNDFSFSIAIHVMNGYQDGTWAHPLPGKLYYTTDRDILIEYEGASMKFLIEKEKYNGEYTLLKTKNLNIHAMNKFSLSRIFKEIEHV